MSATNPELDSVNQFRGEAGAGPIVMVNMVRFHSPEAWQRFSEQMPPIVGPILEELGAEVIYTGAAGPEFNVDARWDLVLIVRYPSFEQFHSLVTHPRWAEAGRAIRDETIADSRLLLTTPLS
jgi:uncharacterized protein (DUF1330 family)